MAAVQQEGDCFKDAVPTISRNTCLSVRNKAYPCLIERRAPAQIANVSMVEGSLDTMNLHVVILRPFMQTLFIHQR